MDLNKLKNPTFLIIDLETDSLDVNKAKIKFFGGYDINKNKYIIKKWDENIQDFIQNLIKQYTFIVTFNGENYDIPILNNNQIDTMYIRNIDLYQVFKKRKAVIFKSEPYSMSLKNLIKILKLDNEGMKGEINYKIFQKDEFTEEEIKEIEIYIKQDLLLTNKLWDFLLKTFEPFKEFVSEENQLRFKYLKSSLGSYAYSVICNYLKIDEKYGINNKEDSYIGAFVKQPIKEFARGDILYFDFASLYPQLYIHANLFSGDCSCCNKDEKWHGNEVFNINGYYCSKKQGQIEELIKQMFLKRKEFKKIGDVREKVYKYILNSLYGVSANPSFSHLYRENVASDCTSLAQQCIKYTIKKFEDNGFISLYADTDSLFVEIPENKTKEDAINLSKQISKEISLNFPFSWEEFNFKIEDEIKYIKFIKNNMDKVLKKNYIYVNKNNELIIKGLDIIQKDCSEISKIIFEKYIKNKIINKLNCLVIEQEELTKIINNLIKEDILICAKRFNVKNSNDYESKTSIYNYITEKYGEGEILMIKNYKLGVGKGIKYCSLEEAKDLKLIDLNLEDVYKELLYFIKDFNKNLINQKNKSLNECLT